MRFAIAPFRRWFTAAALALAAASSVAQERVPQRVVSINLCADQLLLALARPEQIASLSIYATDPELSYSASAARAYRHTAAGAESVVDLNPDLVLAGPFTDMATREMLRRLGYRVVEIENVTTIDQAVDQVREVAIMLGNPDRGFQLAELIFSARLQAGKPGRGATAVVYQRRGYVSGETSLTADLMFAVGLMNVSTRLTGADGGFVPLERLVESPPNYLVVAERDEEAEDQGAALLEHPALVEMFPPATRIELPARLTVCAGPSLPEALRFLSAEIRRVGRWGE